MSFSPVLRRVLVVVILGSIMSFLDSTIVNVALRSLSVNLHSNLATIQWVVTAYLLGLATMIPASGWAVGRFGAKRVYVLSIIVFTLASVACGLAQSAGQLIAFRAIQGAAGGLTLPVAQIIVVRLSGPKLMARVMSAIGIPTILAPIIGPAIGGLILQNAAWNWIFFVNLPIGVVTAILSLRMVPGDEPQRTAGLDVPGLAAVTLGFLAITYGLAQIGTEGHGAGPLIVGLSLAIGVVLLVVFVMHALRIGNPLVDVRLYKNKQYSAASLTTVCVGAALFGSIILMPLYFQLVRHESTIGTGLMLIPQGIGGAIAMVLGARLADRLGSGLTTLIGGAISIVATVPFMLIESGTSYWYLGAAMALRGFGIGTCAIPATAAAYRAISPMKISDATVQLGVLQRIGGSAGTAIFAVVLQRRLTGATDVTGQAAAFGTTFWWVLAVAIVATAPALLLTAAERRSAPAAAST
jgi:EmrB/QacA subfamily drug resistance transporter